MDAAPAVAAPGARIATLDIVRGIAVMGILAMNILGFALPTAAYINPIAYGSQGPADLASWALSYVFVDGKMRGLFSFLFGASMLLVVERAEAAGEDPAMIHGRRMAWLFGFGLIHYYLIWPGDILSLYAPVGLVAFVFHRWRPRQLIAAAAVLLALTFFEQLRDALRLFAAQHAALGPGASAAAIAHYADLQFGIAPYPADILAQMLAIERGSWTGIVAYNWHYGALGPVGALIDWGPETLAYMMLGMAGLKSGFLTGAWSNRAYGWTSAIGFGIGVPAYAAFAWLVLRAGFDPPILSLATFAGSVPLRPPMIAATAALIILATRRDGWLTGRIAAAGRAAFTNYLGTSLVMTTIFQGYGFGLFGHVRRVDLWWFVLAGCAAMLLWSKPWLDRFNYGPFEWLWRSLARGSPQPMRKRI